eukprot:m.39286 g.39286  ORF g.39286 m.39286 type:complete len:1090 (-) comp7942_c0_seq1:51-3320(-)
MELLRPTRYRMHAGSVALLAAGLAVVGWAASAIAQGGGAGAARVSQDATPLTRNTHNVLKSKPNVLILFADDMGVGDLGVYGHPSIKSPNLDALAASGVRFTAWYSGFHICSPSRAAMLTGRLCVRSGTCGSSWTGGVFGNAPVGGLPTNETTFATALKTVGYVTAAIGKWHLGTKAEFMPLGHGFDQYYGIPYSPDMGSSAWNRRGEFPPLPLLSGNTPIEQPTDLNKVSKRYVQYADTFIRNTSSSGQPFLLYLAWNHVHDPDFASPDFCGTSARGLYGDAVEELDWAVGQVLGSVAAVGATDNTIVFFTSDNGPWTSHHLHGGSAGPFRDGKGSVWEGGVREPGLVSWPGTIMPRIESEPVATYDIFPTVLTLAGVAIPAGVTLDGRDMMPLLLAPGSKSAHQCIFYWKGCTSASKCGVPEDSPLVNQHTPGLWAVRCGAYKTHFVATNVSCTVHYMPPGIFQQQPLVYRIDKDPSERFPLDPVANAAEYNAQVTIAKKAVQDHMASLTPVQNQIALGLNKKPIASGGAAFCCANGGSKCDCNPENMNVFVCQDNATSGGPPTVRQVAHGKTSSTSSKEDKSTAKPNVIMLFVDDSGYADSEAYGAPSTNTPGINRMAAEGARFTQWYSAHAICTPSRAALMTGRLPIRYGLASTSTGGQSVFTCRSRLGLPANETTMAELVKPAGYTTHMVGKWHLGSVEEYLPTTVGGFDTYAGIPFSVDMGFAYNNRSMETWDDDYYGCSPLPFLVNTSVVEQPVDLSTVHTRYVASALKFINGSLASQTPFFLYLAFGHVHTPQYAGVAQAGKSKRGVFGDSVAEVDAAVAAVLSAVRGTNTLAILSSDNGAPDAHQHLMPGELLEAFTGSNSLFVGSKTQTWEGGLRVPGILWWPNVIQPQVRHEVASTLDVFATVADAVGVALPTDRIYDSVSLMPLVKGAGGHPPRNASFFYAGSTLQAVRVNQWKAHLVTELPNEPHAGPERGFLNQSGNNHAPYGVQNPWLLFNIERDPSEMFPVTGTLAKPVLVDIAAVVQAHQAQLGTPPIGILDVDCISADCRICCDHTKNCFCNGPPPSVQDSDQTGFSSALH